MGKTLIRTTNFREIKDQVSALMAKEKTYMLSAGDTLPTYDDYSSVGLVNAGKRFSFPADYVQRIAPTHKDLAEDILRTSTMDYLNFVERKSARKRQVLLREFGNGIDGVLSEKYNIFDDDEVTGLVEDNDYLMNSGEFWYNLSPERFHVRFISKTPLTIPGDNSELHMAVFVDNSMLGESSFKVRFGLYRSACTNGMIWGLKEYIILREKHIGRKNIVASLGEALADIDQYERILVNRITEMSTTDSRIRKMTSDEAITYLKGVLSIGEKRSAEIIDIYHNVYGGKTRWDLCNAITEYAHKVDLADRLKLESAALKVA